MRQDPGKRSSSLYVIRRDGGGLQRLTRGDQVVSLPAWRGDGRLLAFSASPLAGGSFDVWTVAPDGGPPRRVLERTGRADRARLHAGGEGHGPGVDPRRAVPGQDERLRHAAGRASRAAARPRPARAVPADDRRHEARLRVGNRQRRQRPRLDPRQQTQRHRPDARRPARPHVRPLRPHVPRRRPTPLYAVTDAHALAPARLPAVRAAHARRELSSFAIARAASASPTTTGLPPAASPRSPAATSTATAPRATQARSPSSRARRSASPTSTPPTSTARTSSSAASRQASTCSSIAPTPISGSRSSTTRTTTPRCGSG